MTCAVDLQIPFLGFSWVSLHLDATGAHFPVFGLCLMGPVG